MSDVTENQPDPAPMPDTSAKREAAVRELVEDAAQFMAESFDTEVNAERKRARTLINWLGERVRKEH